MEKITRADLQRIRESYVEKKRKNLLLDIVKQVKQTAEVGQTSYTHVHYPNYSRLVMMAPFELVNCLREIFVDSDIDYAEPYITIRWN